MKLTTRQKKIVLAFSFFVMLVAILVPTSFYLFNRKIIFQPSTPFYSNKWEKIFWEIRVLLDSNISGLKELREEIKKRKYPDILEGINLAGFGKQSSSRNLPQYDINKLKVQLNNTGFPCPFKEGEHDCLDANNCPIGRIGSQGFFNDFEKNYPKYRNWNLLSSLGDGSCFFHSFSVLLTGKSDKDLAEKLRIATMLEVINNPIFANGSDEKKRLEEVRRLIFHTYTIGRKSNEKRDWASNFACEVMVHVLKRPITIIIKSGNELYPLHFTQYECPNKMFDEEWAIYNSGNHFEPLIP